MRVALVGHGFMGAAHSQAWRVAPRFFDLPLRPEPALLVGRHGAAESADRLGWAESSDDWREAVARDDIDVVDIVTPGDTHAEIAIAALEAGKHVLCEKPLANSIGEAERMASAAAAAQERGAIAMCGFTYRRVPAILEARRLVREGAIGEVREVRAQYLQDWLSDPAGPMTWRLDRAKAGSGSLGDIGAHIIDAAEFVAGDLIASVSGTLETYVRQRPVLAEQRGLGGVASDRFGEVTVDDAAWFTTRFASGAMGSFTATRYATGRKNALRLEVSGTRGALAFDLERLNELEFYDATEPADRLGFRRILATEPEHAFAANWWPTGHALGYEHAFSHQVVDFVTDIAERREPEPSFADALHVQRVLAAVEGSAEAGSAWAAV
nr:Gfo/Idh/MocA family oxidoreductase [Leifsonia shinshuensis]